MWKQLVHQQNNDVFIMQIHYDRPATAAREIEKTDQPRIKNTGSQVLRQVYRMLLERQASK